MTDPDQVPSELAELINAERGAAVAPAADRAAVRTKIAASAGKAALGQSAAGTAFGGAGKVIAVIAIAVAGGAAALIAHGRHEPAPSPTISTPTTEVRAPVLSDVAPVAPVPGNLVVDAHEQEIAPVATVSRPARAVDASKVSRPTGLASPSQPELVRRAWAALQAADTAGALEIVKQDRNEHPDGPLTEERDAIEVLALIASRSISDGAREASRYLSRYPDSIHRALIERALVQRKETP